MRLEPTQDERCGTYAGFVRHGKLNEKKCELCRIAGNEYQNKIRKTRTLKPVIREKCGTTAGYKAHEKHGEFTCDLCRLAINAAVRKRNESKKKERAEKNRNYRAANLNHVRSVEKQWRINNPNKTKAKDNARHARKKGATVVEFFTIEEIINRWGNLCHICGGVIDLSLPRTAKDNKWGLHLDHVIPLVKGGNHTLDNVKPSHAFCNLSKGSNQAKYDS